MATEEKVVIRFIDGSVFKGYLKDFSEESKEITFEEAESRAAKTIRIQELKAIFFVRTFEGDKDYKEIKRYGVSQRKGRKIFVKFQDGESIVGYLQGNIPWQKGFFLSSSDEKKTGFFVLPADEESNNIKVFIIKSSVKDITSIP
ncbi:MAG: hypothetical protein HY755_12975 [Nitrospirae bacterium]|nr:hypothetical protein [Nitrospirota bacterium]